MKELKERAKKGKLSKGELMGGTFSVSKLGMYGIPQAVAVINPPQACVLAIGSADKKPLSRNNKIIHASIMNCTLSADHRVIDGAEASRFLACLKLFLEEPLHMLAWEFSYFDKKTIIFKNILLKIIDLVFKSFSINNLLFLCII